MQTVRSLGRPSHESQERDRAYGYRKIYEEADDRRAADLLVWDISRRVRADRKGRIDFPIAACADGESSRDADQVSEGHAGREGICGDLP